MRVLIGGIIGAALCAAGWLAVEHFSGLHYGWLVCLVGLGAGLGVRCATSSSATTGGSLRGALAVLLTLAAIFFAPIVYTQIVKSALDTDAESKVAMAADADDSGARSEESEESSTEAEAEAEEDVEVDMMETSEPSALDGYKKNSLKRTMEDSDLIWMSLSGLLAYVFGKREAAKETSVEVAETSTPVDESTEA